MADKSPSRENKFIVLTLTDIEKYFSKEQVDQFSELLIQIVSGRLEDKKPPRNSYIVCDQDEPYAEKVWDIILRGEAKKASRQGEPS